MVYLEFAASLVPLLYLLFKEFLSAEAQSKAQDIQFKLTQDNLRAITDAAFKQWVNRLAQESVEMSDSWDAADESFEKEDEKK